MKSKTVLSLMGCIVVCLGVGPLLAGDEAARAQPTEYVPNEILVKFHEDAGPADVAVAASSLGAAHLRTFRSIGVRHWRLGRGLTVEKALEILSKNRNVEYAEPNYIVEAHVLPDDPLRGDLWSLNNVGQTGGTFDADIDAPEAWDVWYDSWSVVVGVIDTGIDSTHPDLAANMWTNPNEIPGNGIDDDRNGIVDDVHGANFIGTGVPTGNCMDDNGHGSHTAGTIGAVGNNGEGVVGVNWHVQLMALKFLNSLGTGDTADAIEAVEYAASFGVRVTNNSWGGGKQSRALKDAIASSGALFVASAGNSHTSTKQYPAGYALENVIAVAATDHNDGLASFSNYGSWVHLAAPGVDTLSCVLNHGYGLKSGTSMASPHVAGAAALVLAYQGGTNADVKAALLDNVDLIPFLTGVVATGGRLNVAAALLGGAPPPPPPDTTAPEAVDDLTVVSTGIHDATLTFTATGDDGAVGQAALYDLRYATGPITSDNWDAATPVTGEPLPQQTGTIETLTVGDLEPATTYSFGLRVADEAGNFTGLSNVPSARTEEAPPSPWTTELLSATGGGPGDLDFHGGPGPFTVGVAMTDNNTVVALLWNGTQWIRETVDPGEGGSGMYFAFAPDGTPSVSYGYQKIKFAWRNPNGTWNVENVEKSPVSNEWCALRYNPAGEPTVAYRKSSYLRFARKVGGLRGTWQAENVQAATARYIDMVYDRDGRPAISYSDDPDGDGWISALKVATKVGSTWQFTTLHEGVVGYGVFASIAVDADGDMIAADSAVWRIFVFHKPFGGTWDAGAYVADGRDLGAAFDGGGTPYVSFVNDNRTSVTFDDGTGWQTERVEDNTMGGSDLRRDSQGGLGVLYEPQTGGIGIGRKPAPW